MMRKFPFLTVSCLHNTKMLAGCVQLLRVFSMKYASAFVTRVWGECYRGYCSIAIACPTIPYLLPQTQVLSLTRLSPLTGLNCDSALVPGFKSSVFAKTEVELGGREIRNGKKKSTSFFLFDDSIGLILMRAGGDKNFINAICYFTHNHFSSCRRKDIFNPTQVTRQFFTRIRYKFYRAAI